jgi:hypothetical protein
MNKYCIAGHRWCLFTFKVMSQFAQSKHGMEPYITAQRCMWPCGFIDRQVSQVPGQKLTPFHLCCYNPEFNTANRKYLTLNLMFIQSSPSQLFKRNVLKSVLI